MKLHYFQHVAFEGLGSIEAWARGRGHELTATRFHLGEPPPAPNAWDWLVVLGGPMNIYEEARHPWLAVEKAYLRGAVVSGRPVLGICLGAQLLADALGARVTRNAQREIGWFPVQRERAAAALPPFRGLPPEFEAFHWHGDTFDLPAGATLVARSAACRHQAFVWENRVVGLQFHLETTPAAVAALVEHCGEDLTPGPFVQGAEGLAARPEQFAAANAWMRRLLDQIEVGASLR